MTEEPQPDLAEGERLLATLNSLRDNDEQDEYELLEAHERFDTWVSSNGEALVAALRVAQQEIEYQQRVADGNWDAYDAEYKLVEQLRADLARVEAEQEHNNELATAYFEKMGQYATELTQLQTRIERLIQALRHLQPLIHHSVGCEPCNLAMELMKEAEHGRA